MILKTAWVLPVLMMAVLILAALLPATVYAAGDEFHRRPLTHYKDLPGVVPEASRVDPDSYSCTSDIEYIYRGRGNNRILGGDVAPTRIYRCKTESGLSYSGTSIPGTHWVPGLNPRHLPQ